MARGSKRHYARTDRVGELLREILATEIDHLDDERLVNVSLTGVDVDNELVKAVVFFDVLDDEDREDAEAAFWEHRGRLRSAIGRESRLRRAPELFFEVDPSIAAAARIDELLEAERGSLDDGADGAEGA